MFSSASNNEFENFFFSMFNKSVSTGDLSFNVDYYNTMDPLDLFDDDTKVDEFICPLRVPCSVSCSGFEETCNQVEGVEPVSFELENIEIPVEISSPEISPDSRDAVVGLFSYLIASLRYYCIIRFLFVKFLGVFVVRYLGSLFVRAVSSDLIDLLLVLGGIERNPGPGKGEKVAKGVADKDRDGPLDPVFPSSSSSDVDSSADFSIEDPIGVPSLSLFQVDNVCDFFSRIRFHVGDFDIKKDSDPLFFRISSNVFDLVELIPTSPASRSFVALSHIYNSFRVVKVSYDFHVLNQDKKARLAISHGVTDRLFDSITFIRNEFTFKQRSGLDEYLGQNRKISGGSAAPDCFGMSKQAFRDDPGFIMSTTGEVENRSQLMYIYFGSQWVGDDSQDDAKLKVYVSFDIQFFNVSRDGDFIRKINTNFFPYSFGLNTHYDAWWMKMRDLGIIGRSYKKDRPVLNSLSFDGAIPNIMFPRCATPEELFIRPGLGSMFSGVNIWNSPAGEDLQKFYADWINKTREEFSKK